MHHLIFAYIEYYVLVYSTLTDLWSLNYFWFVKQNKADYLCIVSVASRHIFQKGVDLSQQLWMIEIKPWMCQS